MTKQEKPDNIGDVDDGSALAQVSPSPAPDAAAAPARRRSTPGADGAGVAIAGLHDRTAALERDVADLKGRPAPTTAAAPTAPAPWYDRDLGELLGLDGDDDDNADPDGDVAGFEGRDE